MSCFDSILRNAVMKSCCSLKRMLTGEAKHMIVAFPDYAHYIWQMLAGSRLQHELQLAGWRTRDISSSFALDHEISVLDLANGRLRPQYSILRSEGQHVYGVDLA